MTVYDPTDDTPPGIAPARYDYLADRALRHVEEQLHREGLLDAYLTEPQSARLGAIARAGRRWLGRAVEAERAGLDLPAWRSPPRRGR